MQKETKITRVKINQIYSRWSNTFQIGNKINIVLKKEEIEQIEQKIPKPKSYNDDDLKLSDWYLLTNTGKLHLEIADIINIIGEKRIKVG